MLPNSERQLYDAISHESAYATSLYYTTEALQILGDDITLTPNTLRELFIDASHTQNVEPHLLYKRSRYQSSLTEFVPRAVFESCDKNGEASELEAGTIDFDYHEEKWKENRKKLYARLTSLESTNRNEYTIIMHMLANFTALHYVKNQSANLRGPRYKDVDGYLILEIGQGMNFYHKEVISSAASKIVEVSYGLDSMSSIHQPFRRRPFDVLVLDTFARSCVRQHVDYIKYRHVQILEYSDPHQTYPNVVIRNMVSKDPVVQLKMLFNSLQLLSPTSPDGKILICEDNTHTDTALISHKLYAEKFGLEVTSTTANPQTNRCISICQRADRPVWEQFPMA